MVTEADWKTWRVEDLRPYADTVLDAFGPSRVMFGSDWPVCTLAASYAEVADTALALTRGLGEHERTQVLEGTATRVYRL
jgi:L-fuconolactonase